jgi:CRISPR-associated protein Csx10
MGGRNEFFKEVGKDIGGSMHQLRYRITALSPLIIPIRLGDMNMVNTEKYIPGTVVLGLLARQFILKKGISSDTHADENFYSWFLIGNLKISNAYILSKDKYGKTFINLPVSFSVQKEKSGRRIYDLLYPYNAI